jgi:hypothetical protein
MRSLGKATAAIPLRDGPVLRRGFAQTLRVGSKNFTEQFMLDGHAPPLAFSKAQSPLTYWFSVRTSMLILNLKTAKVLGITVHWSFKLDRHPAAVNVASSRLYLALMSPPASGACKTSKTMLMRMLPTA